MPAQSLRQGSIGSAQSYPDPPASSSERNLEDVFQKTFYRSLRPVTTGLGVLYLVFAAGHFLWSPSVADIMSPVALITAVLLFGLRIGLGARKLPETWAHPLGGAVAGLVLINSLLHLYLTWQPYQTTNVALLAIGVGILFLSTRWLLIVLATAAASWSFLVWMAPASPQWTHFQFLMLTATVLALIAHAARIRTLAELESMRSTVQEMALRKRVENELREARVRDQALLNALPDLIFRIDSKGTFLDFVPGKEIESAVVRRDAVGKNWYDLVPPTLAERVRDYLIATLESGETRVFEYHLQAAGKEQDYEARLVKCGANEALVIVREITDRKQAEQERKRLEGRMQQAQKRESLGVMAAGVAHDFNNLLVAILGHADLALSELQLDSPLRPGMEEIKFAAKRAAELTNQMLAYAGKGRLALEPVNLSLAVQELSHLLHSVVSKKTTLHFSLAPGLPATEGDLTQLRQVAMNLITNASEALGDDNGDIYIATGLSEVSEGYFADACAGQDLPAGRYVYLEVSDTGCCMNAATMRKIFDPFFSTKFAGRGLGLAVVLGIVQGHRGAIKLDSRLGHGTTVTVLLPATPSATEPAGERSHAVGSWRGHGTILVVDDEAAVREVAGTMLSKVGFRVLTARDGREAVRTFRDHLGEIVLVILDQTMPGMDGKQALRELKRIRPDVPVLMSSGYNEQETSTRFATDDLAGVIPKPYEFEALIHKVRQALEP